MEVKLVHESVSAAWMVLTGMAVKAMEMASSRIKAWICLLVMKPLGVLLKVYSTFLPLYG